MLIYVVRRVIASIPVVFGASVFAFLLVKLSGDPLDELRARHPRPPERVIQLQAHRLRLDRPLWEQYWLWLKGLVLHGDFGPSVHSDADIGHDLAGRLVVSLRLIVLAVVLAFVFAVVAGLVSAVKQYSMTDHTLTFVSVLFLAMPLFWFAILLKNAGIWVNELDGDPSTRIFYTIGERSVLLDDDSTWTRVKDAAGHLILPTAVLGLCAYAAWSRFQRAATLESLDSDHVRLARAKGLRPGRVLVRHALRTSLIPLTTVTALDLAALLGQTIVTERVFQWRGMGDYLLESIRDRDTYAVLAWLLVAAGLVIVFNLAADLLYGVLDPRSRHG